MRGSSSRNLMSWKGRWANKLGGLTCDSCDWTEVMGFMLVFVLVNCWSACGSLGWGVCLWLVPMHTASQSGIVSGKLGALLLPAEEHVSLTEVELACSHAPTHRVQTNWDVAVASGMIGRFHVHAGNEWLWWHNSDGHKLCSVHICDDASHDFCQTHHCHNEVSASWFIHLQLAVLSFFAVLSQPFSVLSLSQQFAVLRVWFSVLAWLHNLLCSDSASCLLCFASNLLFSAGNSLCWDWLIQQFSVLWQFSVLRWQFSVLSLQLAVLSISAVMSQQFSVLSLSQQLAVLRACFSVLILISQFAALRLCQLSVVLCQQLAVLSWEFSLLRLIDPAVFCAETTFFCAEMTIFCAEPASFCAELFAVLSQQFSVLSLSQQFAMPRMWFALLGSISWFAVLRLSQLSAVLSQQIAVLMWQFALLRLINPAFFCAEMTIFCAEMIIFCAEPATHCAELVFSVLSQLFSVLSLSQQSAMLRVCFSVLAILIWQLGCAEIDRSSIFLCLDDNFLCWDDNFLCWACNLLCCACFLLCWASSFLCWAWANRLLCWECNFLCSHDFTIHCAQTQLAVCCALPATCCSQLGTCCV